MWCVVGMSIRDMDSIFRREDEDGDRNTSPSPSCDCNCVQALEHKITQRRIYTKNKCTFYYIDNTDKEEGGKEEKVTAGDPEEEEEEEIPQVYVNVIEDSLTSLKICLENAFRDLIKLRLTESI